MKKIILKGKRITLRPYRLSDARIFFGWFKHKEAYKYLGVEPPKNLREQEKFVRKNWHRKNGYSFAVENENGDVIGSCGIGFEFKNGSATLGIFIGEMKEWNKGYGSEVIKTQIQCAFANKKIHRVQLRVSKENSRAVRAYEKAGFVREGVERQATWNPVLKRFDDDIIMSILRSEWNKTKM